jgi:ssDNA-binding Zn-finger/Zn-ribbon topoisomerase 1
MVIYRSKIFQDLINIVYFHLCLRDRVEYQIISLGKREDYIMEDRTLVCKDCGKEFIFTVGEQEFYKEKGFDNDPVRCPDCRRSRKQQRNNRSYDR